MLHVDQVVIIGTGLLGASIGLGLKSRGYTGEVVGVGRRRETLEAARARGAVDRGTLTLADAATPGSLIILATPLSGFPEAFDRVAELPQDGLVITDVGSVKARVMAEAQRRLRPDQTFVGSHPMAGGEEQGPDAADPDLFVAKPCAVVVDDGAPQAAFDLVRGLWRGLGMTIHPMAADDHDAMVATVSHVPHLACSMLVHLAAKRGGWDLASTGFRDATRLASGNPPMWRDIVEWNRDAIRAALRDLRGDVDALLATVEAGDDASLLDWLESSKARRDDWLARRA